MGAMVCGHSVGGVGGGDCVVGDVDAVRVRVWVRGRVGGWVAGWGGRAGGAQVVSVGELGGVVLGGGGS